MSVGYRILYGLRVTPCEEIADLSEVNERFVAHGERQEDGREPPHGPVLDVGCGSGIWAVKLAQRGWQVTSVDNVPKALRRARERAA